jgi:hypothetical protein
VFSQLLSGVLEMTTATNTEAVLVRVFIAFPLVTLRACKKSGMRCWANYGVLVGNKDGGTP